MWQLWIEEHLSKRHCLNLCFEDGGGEHCLTCWSKVSHRHLIGFGSGNCEDHRTGFTSLTNYSVKPCFVIEQRWSAGISLYWFAAILPFRGQMDQEKSLSQHNRVTVFFFKLRKSVCILLSLERGTRSLQ